MKRILLAVITILASASLTAATTTAAWTDTVSATDITIQSASADLQIWTSLTNAYGTTGDSPFNIIGLEPGVTKEDNDAFWLKQFVLSPDATGMTLKGKITSFTVEDSSTHALISDADLLNALDNDVEIQIFEIIAGVPGLSSDWYTLSEWMLSSGRNLNSNLDSTNRVKEYGIKVRFVANPEDEWQSKTLKFDLEVSGTQL